MTDGKWKEMAERTTILRADVGSRGFGLSIDTSDYDEMGVCIEDFSAHTTLEGKFEQYTYKDPPDPETNFPGRDLTIYSLEKFIRLAVHGNPTILSLLFAEVTISANEVGRALQGLAPSLISRHWGKRFLGYMESQRQKLVGERGQKRVTRQELVDKHGFDTKYAMHLLRLGFQGVEVMDTGRMSLPIKEDVRVYLRKVRSGEVDLNEVLQQAGELERRLKDQIDGDQWPDEPSKDYVDVWLRSAYWETWARNNHELQLTLHELLNHKA